MDAILNVLFFAGYAWLFSILPRKAYQQNRKNISTSFVIAAVPSLMAAMVNPLFPSGGMSGLWFAVLFVHFTLPVTLITLLIWAVKKPKK